MSPNSPVIGKDRSTSRGPWPCCDRGAGGPGLPWRLRRVWPHPVRNRHDNAGPLTHHRDPPKTLPRSPGRGGGRALSTSREAEPDERALDADTGGTSSTGAPRSNAPSHWLAEGRVTAGRRACAQGGGGPLRARGRRRAGSAVGNKGMRN